MSTTARLHLPYPELTDGPDGADVPYWIKTLALALDIAAVDDQGILANRPAAGTKGRYWMVVGDTTPANNGVLYRDNGISWDVVGPIAAGSIDTTQLANGAVTTVKLADANVTTAKLVDANVTTGKLADGAVTGAKIADALKPSTGAGGGTEALRALGVVTGTAAAGNDARLSDTRTPTDGTVTTPKLADAAVTSAKIAETLTITRPAIAQGADLTLTAGEITITTHFHRVTATSGGTVLTTINAPSNLGGALIYLLNYTGASFDVEISSNIYTPEAVTITVHNSAVLTLIRHSVTGLYHVVDYH